MNNSQDNFELPPVGIDLTVVHGSIKRAMKDAQGVSRDFWMVPIENIRVIHGFNCRIRSKRYLEHLESITQSILTEGFWSHSPLEGYVANENGEHVIYVVGGHTRLEAAHQAIARGAQDLTHLPLVPRTKGTSAEDMVVSLVKGNEGLPLTPLEKAIVCKRLANFGWANEQIAKRLSMTEVYVDGLLLLVGAPIEIRQMVENEEISATTAIHALRSHGSGAVKLLQEGKGQAEAQGKKRITAKHLPGAKLQRSIKKMRCKCTRQSNSFRPTPRTP